MVDHPYPSLTNNDHCEVKRVAALHQGSPDLPGYRALEHACARALGLTHECHIDGLSNLSVRIG